jgi:RNA polymerase subunit RPABC4/transcription elongation factor Spt4
MDLTEEIEKRVYGYLKEMEGGIPERRICPVCKVFVAKNWEIRGPLHLVETDSFPGIHRPYMALLLLACKTCGYVKMFSWDKVFSPKAEER